jgi:hypothetical protein
LVARLGQLRAGRIMNREDDYRTKAAASLHRAVRATSTAVKIRLLGMAEAWLELADRAHKVAEPRIRDMADHPRVRSKLGPSTSAITLS